MVNDSGQTTITKEQGDFLLDVEQDRTLVITSLGCTTRTMDIPAGANVKIAFSYPATAHFLRNADTSLNSNCTVNGPT